MDLVILTLWHFVLIFSAVDAAFFQLTIGDHEYAHCSLEPKKEIKGGSVTECLLVCNRENKNGVIHKEDCYCTSDKCKEHILLPENMREGLEIFANQQVADKESTSSQYAQTTAVATTTKPEITCRWYDNMSGLAGNYYEQVYNINSEQQCVEACKNKKEQNDGVKGLSYKGTKNNCACIFGTNTINLGGMRTCLFTTK